MNYKNYMPEIKKAVINDNIFELLFETDENDTIIGDKNLNQIIEICYKFNLPTIDILKGNYDEDTKYILDVCVLKHQFDLAMEEAISRIENGEEYFYADLESDKDEEELQKKNKLKETKGQKVVDINKFTDENIENDNNEG